jgi:hypothetical protein
MYTREERGSPCACANGVGRLSEAATVCIAAQSQSVIIVITKLETTDNTGAAP